MNRREFCVAFGLVRAAAYAQAERLLKRLHLFTVGSLVPKQGFVQDLAAGPDVLCFLIAKYQFGIKEYSVVGVSVTGSEKWSFRVPTPTLQIGVRRSGSVVLYQGCKTQKALVEYGPDGRQLSSRTVTEVPLAFCVVGDHVLSAFGRGALEVYDLQTQRAQTIPLSGPLPEFVSLEPMTAGQAVLIDQESGSLDIFDLRASSSTKFKINAPEVERGISLYQQRRKEVEAKIQAPNKAARGVVVFASTSVAGRAYALLSPISTKQGALIVELTSAGLVTRRLRCPLWGDTPNNVPHKMAILGSELFLATPVGEVASYQLGQLP